LLGLGVLFFRRKIKPKGVSVLKKVVLDGKREPYWRRKIRG